MNHRRRFVVGTALAVVAASALPACTFHADTDHAGPDAPRADPAGPGRGPRGRTLVLSSGGPRGYVHVGVLKALDELNLRPDFIVGASVGALVGALYASGTAAATIEALALDLSPVQLARIALGSSERLDGSPLAIWVRQQTGFRSIEQLPIPFAAVAIERSSRHAIAFTAGDVGVAVQASAAIEGLYTPVRVRGNVYVDADAATPLPVRLAQRLGGRRVLAIDASAHEDRAPAGAERFRDGDRVKRANTAPDAAAADLCLHPDFGYWVSGSREFRERAIAAGWSDTHAAATRLRRLWQPVAG